MLPERRPQAPDLLTVGLLIDTGLPGAGSLAPGMVSVGVVRTEAAAEAVGLAKSAEPAEADGSAKGACGGLMQGRTENCPIV